MAGQPYTVAKNHYIETRGLSVDDKAKLFELIVWVDTGEQPNGC